MGQLLFLLTGAVGCVQFNDVQRDVLDAGFIEDVRGKPQDVSVPFDEGFPVSIADSGVGRAEDAWGTVDVWAATDGGQLPAGRFGMCSGAVAMVCMCTATDSLCINRAYSADATCVQCLVQNQADCCPVESTAFQNCVSDAEGACGSDTACLLRACMAQSNTLVTCQNARLQAEEMGAAGVCLSGFVACLGDLSTGLGACP